MKRFLPSLNAFALSVIVYGSLDRLHVGMVVGLLAAALISLLQHPHVKLEN